MENKVFQKSLQELANDLAIMISDLGPDTDMKTLELIQAHSQELHNRITIVHYKAGELWVKDGKDSHRGLNAKKRTKIESQESTNQESLFSFNMVSETIPKVEVEKEPEIIKEIIPEVKNDNEEDLSKANSEIIQDKITQPTATKESSNTLLDGKQTLADKLNATKISSISDVMGIQEKFQYLNELFEGDHVQFSDSLTRLDNAPDEDQAKNLLGSLTANYQWDLENKVVQNFIQLVERKHKS
jgi:hypothetical protein